MVDMLMVRAEAPPRLATTSRRARPMVPLARQPGPKQPAAQLMSRALRTGPLTMKRGEGKLVVADTPWRSKASSHMASTPAMITGMYSGRQPAITALTAIFSTVPRPKLGGTNAMSSLASRPEPATMAATRSRVGGTTGRPSVTPRSKSTSKGSTAASLTIPSGLADPEVAVIALGHRLGVVGIRQHGNARGLRDVGLIEELFVVLEDVDPLLRPLVFVFRAALHHEDLGQAAARGQARAYRHHRAPDVFHGLDRPRGVREHRVHRHRAVVGLGLTLVGALGKDHGTPRPGEHRVGLEIPLVLLGRLDTQALGHRVQEAEPVHLLDRVHLAARILARLPVGRELPHLAFGEGVDGDTVLGVRRGGERDEQREEYEGEPHHGPQRPRRHHEWTS